MTSKLEVYNLSLIHLGERRLASLSEDRGPKRELDSVWDASVRYCLEGGMWNFAKRVVSIDKSTDVVPEFGYTNAFEKPDDWIRTMRVAEHDRFDPPLLDVQDEAGVWYANCDPLYVEYVSNGEDYGGNLSKWQESFADYVALRLAQLTCVPITSSEEKIDRINRAALKALKVARARDAMNQPPGFPPQGTWVTSRTAGRSRLPRWDGTLR